MLLMTRCVDEDFNPPKPKLTSFWVLTVLQKALVKLFIVPDVSLSIRISMYYYRFSVDRSKQTF